MATKTVLFTGLPAAGKSTIASRVLQCMRMIAMPAKWLDGDLLRAGLSADLGFSSADRRENLRRMAEVAKLFNDEGIRVLSSFIAPLESDRALIRDIVGAEAYVEVFVDAPIEVCRLRDPKGWYRKSRTGDVKNFTGVDARFEQPQNPHLILRTDLISVEECTEQVLNLLAKL